jgi:small GTP-binding protein
MPQPVEDWLKVFPPLVRASLRALYQALSPEQRSAIDLTVGDIERYMSANDLKDVLDLVKEQFPERDAVSATICIVGPVNTGKSSLYNALIGEGQPRAEVSPIPGTTKSPQSGERGPLTVVDTPGADDVEIGDEGELEGQQRREAALSAAQQADFLVIVFDASAGIGRGALAVYNELQRLGKPYVVVQNKIDLVRRYEDKVIALAARHLGLAPEAVIPTSALKGTGLDKLIFAILKTDPALLLTIAQVMPHYRFKLAQRRAIQAATAAGTVNLATAPIPIPFASFVPLTGIQAGLVLSIARIYGYQITPARAKELLTAFATGLGARTLFQQLVTKVPGAGWVLGTAIAAATTLAIGYSAMAWFARGEKVSTEVTRAYVEAITQEIVTALRELDRKSLSREGLKALLERVTARSAGRMGDKPATIGEA